jgi:hypothetical protein
LTEGFRNPHHLSSAAPKPVLEVENLGAQAGGERAGLQTCSFSRAAIGISRKLIAVNRLIQKP